MTDVALKLSNLTKRYGAVTAVRDVALEVRRGEFVSLLGPSGCGKTTTLRMIAGYIRPDGGSIAIEGEDVTHIPPYRRDIGMVFQSYALFPHMTVEQNVGFGLQMRKIPKDEIRTRVAEALKLVRLEGLGARKPSDISGGQQQRVALARAIVIRPRLLLLDEPLSNLDAKLRKSMQIEIRSLQESLGITTIHVTHDQTEALSLSDRVVIMNLGEIQQVGPPREVYVRPKNVFVADFVGESNLLKGRVAGLDAASGMIEVTLATGERLKVSAGTSGIAAGSSVAVVARPEAIRLSPAGKTEANAFQGMADRVVYTGAISTTIVRLPSGLTLTVEDQNDDPTRPALQPKQPVTVTLPPATLLIVPE